MQLRAYVRWWLQHIVVVVTYTLTTALTWMLFYNVLFENVSIYTQLPYFTSSNCDKTFFCHNSFNELLRSKIIFLDTWCFLWEMLQEFWDINLLKYFEIYPKGLSILFNKGTSVILGGFSPLQQNLSQNHFGISKPLYLWY